MAAGIVIDTTVLVNNDDPAWREELEGLEEGEKRVLWMMFDEDTRDKMILLTEEKEK